MKFITIILLCSIVSGVSAQNVRDGHDGHPLRFSLEANDSLDKTEFIPLYHQYIDTTGTRLWKIGTTSKPYFSLGTGNSVSIMTDTAMSYPVRADDYFVLRYYTYANGIFSFMHKYNTTQGRDGGVVEYSIDTGKTWKNALGSCNMDGESSVFSAILTENFYKKTDTLYNGLQGFSGNSGGWKKSRMQVYHHPFAKNTATDTCVSNDVFIRFRFVSDSIADNKDGWLIDNIILERDEYSSVPLLAFEALQVYPNPVTDGIVYFPAMANSHRYNISITSIAGKVLYDEPYTTIVNLQNHPPGMYFYKVTNGQATYAGKIIVQ